MKVQTFDGTTERLVITGMITSTSTLARVVPLWTKGSFPSPVCDRLAEICVNYFQKYNRAPRKNVIGLFAAEVGKRPDSELAKTGDIFLSGLSDDYAATGKACNPEYLADQARDIFRRRRLSKMLDTARGHLDAGRLDQAEASLADHVTGADELDDGSPLFTDPEEIEAVFRDNHREPLVEYPEPLNKFFGATLSRDSLLAFLAPEKTGKSWMLIDLAFRAVSQRRRTAYFEVGDMSKQQVRERFLVRAASHPSVSPDGRWPYAAKHPTKLEVIPDPEDPTRKKASVIYEERVFQHPLRASRAKKASARFMKDVVRSEEAWFRIWAFPNSTMNIPGIEARLKDWSRRKGGWSPDVVVIDYADILAPPPGRQMDLRDQINTNWKQMRALSQKLHCLVVTATQANAASYSQYSLDRRSFSEDKRKLAHVTGMVGLNVGPEEKDQGVMRLNWIAAREMQFSQRRYCWLAGCLAVGDPAVLACYPWGRKAKVGDD